MNRKVLTAIALAAGLGFVTAAQAAPIAAGSNLSLHGNDTYTATATSFSITFSPPMQITATNGSFTVLNPLPVTATMNTNPSPTQPRRVSRSIRQQTVLATLQIW